MSTGELYRRYQLFGVGPFIVVDFPADPSRKSRSPVFRLGPRATAEQADLPQTEDAARRLILAAATAEASGVLHW
jgi:hypothetical protein